MQFSRRPVTLGAALVHEVTGRVVADNAACSWAAAACPPVGTCSRAVSVPGRAPRLCCSRDRLLRAFLGELSRRHVDGVATGEFPRGGDDLRRPVRALPLAQVRPARHHSKPGCCSAASSG